MVNDVVVRLAGGLGNQLFQIFAGLSCIEGYRENVWLYTQSLADYSSQRTFVSSFVLNIFQNVKSANPSVAHRLIIEVRLPRFIDRIIGDIGFASTSLGIMKISIKRPALVFLDGYFQDPFLPRHEENRLLLGEKLSEFGLSIRNEIFRSSKNVVALHVRRGDYIDNKTNATTFCCLQSDYYQQAIQLLGQAKEVAIFSDDPEAAAEYARIFHGISVCQYDLSLQEEFCLFASCDHYVIANSTFSWWAAYLGWSEGKRFIAPLRWFKNDKMNFENQLIRLPFIETI